MAEPQNIFDNSRFFSGYSELREGPNFNDWLEQPAMAALLPPVEGAKVLDIGCGFGRNCADFLERGARDVVGIDISEKMLSVARKEHSAPRLRFLNLDMDSLPSGLEGEGPFDLVYSSLAFHYSQNWSRLCAAVAGLLSPGGVLLFSQEHPVVTAPVDGSERWTKDSSGRARYLLSDYPAEGERSVKWFVDGVIHQHRTFSTIINGLVDAGLRIAEVAEPCPGKAALKAVPGLKRELVKPSFLIVKAEKPKEQRR